MYALCMDSQRCIRMELIICHKNMRLPAIDVLCSNPNIFYYKCVYGKGFILPCQRNCQYQLWRVFYGQIWYFSLFTNIPLKEIIDICINNFFQTDETIQGFSKENLKKMLDMSVQNCHFILNNVQRDGVDIGPTLANVFLCHHEDNWFSNCPSHIKPSYYKRFVDDTFLIFKSLTYVSELLSYHHSQHPNM